MKNRTLLVIILVLLPFVVISFSFKSGKTNFNLEKNDDTLDALEDDDSDTDYKVKIKTKDEILELDLEDYIVGVVAGEMPASFEMEALKAQAVASRTFALYKKERSYLEYDLTDDTNSQVYISIEDMQKKWGAEFDKYYNRVLRAVEETKGEVITYEGNIIEAFYFSMSGGSTQEASTVFNENREYLKSVVSEYDNESLNNYEVTKIFSISDFISLLDLSCEKVNINNIDYNDAGYVESITVCGKEFKGTTFRFSLGLRSTNFDITVEEEVSITTRGYGHGVGMSQYGANGYAGAGYSYQDILKHYYTDVEIENIKDV